MPGIDRNRRVALARQKTSRRNIWTLSPMQQESFESDSSYTTPTALAHSTHTHEGQTISEPESKYD